MSNESYIQGIIDQIARIPTDMAKQVGAEIFMEAVNRTRVDSGQAAANWQFAPYQGEYVEIDQQMMWGYGDIEPISPVGYKWAKYDNSEAVYRYQFERMTDALASAPDDITGVAVYNPISVGYGAFAPGTDVFYPENAFRNVDLQAIAQVALDRVYAEYGATFGGGRGA